MRSQCVQNRATLSIWHRASPPLQACHWFDCAFLLSRSPTDLLSSANMRVQLDPAAPLARALYLHAFALPALSDSHREMAERKLDAIAEQEAANRRQALLYVREREMVAAAATLLDS